MNDNKNYAIGVLSITAVILLVGILLTTNGHHQQVHAFGHIDRGGDYIVMTGQFSQNSELVYITDAAARRLNAYSYEPTTRNVVLWDSVDLGRLDGGGRRRR